ncbi:hypothetical protein [Streptomyces sp. NPDC094032]|uniref:hypothetical protein n=1 Tax=Streptomyces sp. NPDC094032 TaxID=3155308 RepID=UPI00332CADA2
MDNSLRDLGCGLTLLLIALGSVTLWRGVIDLRDGTTIYCVNRRMAPGDTCVMRAGSNRVQYTYEEKSADWDNSYPILATAAGATVLVGSVTLGAWLTRQGAAPGPQRRGPGAKS